MSPLKALPFILAFVLCALIPLVFFPGLNESQPIIIFIICPVLFAVAAYLSVRKTGDWKFWVGWSTFIGLVIAAGLVFVI